MKILIIKLGAKGDVVRSLSILPALKEKYAEAEIYWVTKKESVSLFDGNPYVKKVYPIGERLNESFDQLYNFDIEDDATNLAQKVKAGKKFGFYSEGGYPAVFNLGSEYYLNTLFDDNLKKENKRTYQEMLFECAELVFKGEHCPIYLSDKEKKDAEKFAEGLGIKTQKLIGIHMGASKKWPSKIWDRNKVIEFVEKTSKKGYDILLFGGPDEIKEQKEISDILRLKKIRFFQNNPNNSDREFYALVNLCKTMICSDSLSLHVSLALKKKTIGLFFCTSPSEIEGYGLLKKIIAPRLKEFFPERMDQYDKELVNSISADEVLKAVNSFSA